MSTLSLHRGELRVPKSMLITNSLVGYAFGILAGVYPFNYSLKQFFMQINHMEVLVLSLSNTAIETKSACFIETSL